MNELVRSSLVSVRSLSDIYRLMFENYILLRLVTDFFRCMISEGKFSDRYTSEKNVISKHILEYSNQYVRLCSLLHFHVKIHHQRERDSIFVFRLKNVTKIFYRWAQFVSLGGWFILYLLEVYVE